MNRFVAGGRLYQRSEIWFSYSAKQNLKAGSPLIVLKRRFDPDESFVDMVADMHRQLHEDRFGSGISALGHGDRPHHEAARARPAGSCSRSAASPTPSGCSRQSFIDSDPLYASAFFANLGSIGMDAGWHHLYEYGTIGVFGVLGRPTSEPGSPTSGPDRRRTMALRWTYDERIEDGLVAGYGLRAVQAVPRGSGRRGASAHRLTDLARRRADGDAGSGALRAVPRRLVCRPVGFAGRRGPRSGRWERAQ